MVSHEVGKYADTRKIRMNFVEEEILYEQYKWIKIVVLVK